jgi:hypothetical protein
MTKRRFKPQSWHASYVSNELSPEAVEALSAIRQNAVQAASVADLMLRSPCDSNYATMLDYRHRVNAAFDAFAKSRLPQPKKRTSR